MNRRSLGFLICFCILSGCDKDPSKKIQDEKIATPFAPNDNHPEFVRLPDHLRDCLQARLARTDTLKVEPLLASTTSADEIRSLLELHQDLVLRTIEASKNLTGRLPPEAELSDAEINANKHLDQVQGRLLVCARDLLLADAVRCWERHEYANVGARYAASLRIGSYLASQTDQKSQFRGRQVLAAIVFDINTLLDKGFASNLTSGQRTELRDLLLRFDLSQWPTPTEGTALKQALDISLQRLTI